MIYNNILEAIGHTPIIRLNRINKPGNADILVKFEGLNVGGSIKTRTGYNYSRAYKWKSGYRSCLGGCSTRLQDNNNYA